MSKSTSTGQSLYRLTVMAGTLFVGSMAAYLYGPPPERVADLLNMAIGKLSEVTDQLNEHRDSNSPIAESNPVIAQASAHPATESALFAPPPVASVLQETTISPGIQTEVDPTEPLRQAGATQASVVPWGSDHSLYRAAAKIPVSPGGLTRQLDAIAETPEKAVQAVLAQVNMLR